MPSPFHEFVVDLLRDRPALALDLAGLTRAGTPRVVEAAFPEVGVAALAADLAIALDDGDGVPRFVVIVEVQLGEDPAKAVTWPRYLVSAYTRWRCPAALVVVAPDADIAAWAAREIPLGPSLGPCRPFVIGPASIPRLVDPAAARDDPRLAVLSAVAHGGEPDGYDVLAALADALWALPDAEALPYTEVVLKRFPAAMRRAMEETMPLPKDWEPENQWTRKAWFEGIEKGHKQGQHDATLRIVLRQLARRIGLPGEPLQARLTALPLADLEALEEALQAFATPDDLTAWLDALLSR